MMEQGRLLDWLYQTRALEEGSVEAMAQHAPRLGNHPALAALLSDNLNESKMQAIRLDACIDALDGDAAKPRAKLRNGAALAEASQALSRVLLEEEATRGMLALYALKHLEIGSYRFLATEAERCDEPDIASICRHSLKEEVAMAARIELELALGGGDEEAAAPLDKAGSRREGGTPSSGLRPPSPAGGRRV